MYFIAKLFKALNSDASPWQLALGIMFGMVVGLTPFWRLHNILILFVVLFFRVNIGTFLLSLTAFGILAFVLDPAMVWVGEAVLTAESLKGLWTSVYNTDLGQVSQFFHTLTMGSLVVSALFCPVVLLLSKWLVVKYREHIMAWVEQLKIVQFLKGTRVFEIYQKLEG